jgi:hypothetical protein
MAEDSTHQGGCGCGALRYQVRGEPIYVNNCHCRQCQRQTGSTSVVNAFFEAERLTVTSGETTRNIFVAGSGGDHQVIRCAACGTAIWSFYPRLGELGLGLRVGTLDEPDALRPDAVIFTQEAMSWVTLPEGIPHFVTTYDPSELLPAGRLARLRALAQLKAGQA